MNKNLIGWLVLVIIIAVGAGIWWQFSRPEGGSLVTPVATNFFVCRDNKTIEAEFFDQVKEPVTSAKPGEPPTPTGVVNLKLSDGRHLTLPQTISADGIRYATSDESLVFWAKGNGALVLEHNEEKSYIGCILVKPETDKLSQVYYNSAYGFTLRYPAGYTVGEMENGIKFTIPGVLAAGTNLGTDSYLSVEEKPLATRCAQGIATSTEAAAGNRYEETVYVLPDTNPCVTVRYLVHYGVLENYPAGSVRPFDRAALIKQFDQIRQSLVVNQ